MTKKKVAAFVIMTFVCVLGVQLRAQNERVSFLVESADSITALEGTRHYIGYIPSGRIVTTDLIMDCKLRGHEGEYVVVTRLIGNKVQQRTWCRTENIRTAELVFKGATSTQEGSKTTINITFTNGDTWVSHDAFWLSVLPGQKMVKTTYDGETFGFTQFVTDGSVDQDVYKELAMK